MHPKDYAAEKPEPKTWASDGDGSARLLYLRLRAGEHGVNEEMVVWWASHFHSVRQRVAALFDEGKFHWACWLVVKYGTRGGKLAVAHWEDINKKLKYYLIHYSETSGDFRVQRVHWDTPEIRVAFYGFAERLGADLKAGRLGEYPPKREYAFSSDFTPSMRLLPNGIGGVRFLRGADGPLFYNVQDREQWEEIKAAGDALCALDA